MRVQISCINKTPRYDPWDRIDNIGGRNPNGSRWKMSVSRAISGIDTGQWSFFVSVGGRAVDVVVARSRYGNRYLRTVADGDQPNNLLALPECPA